MCADRDPAVVDVVQQRIPDATICTIDGAHPGAARNLLVERSRGELLLFLDDDVTVEPDLLARLARVADEHPTCDVFGGPNDTPSHSSRFQITQGAVLASIVGSGPVRRRYGAHPPGEADERFFILCNLAVRRRVMVAFSTELLCAEENELLAELASRHVTMYYDPELVAYHERRATLSGFARQMHKYGQGRGQVLVRRPRSTRPAYLVPTGLLVYLVVAPALVLAFGALALLPLVAYLAAVVACAAWIARTLGRPGEFPRAVWLTIVLHGCYGSGVVRGALRSRDPIPQPVARGWWGPTVETAESSGRSRPSGIVTADSAQAETT